MANVIGQMVKTQWDFSKFQTVQSARAVYARRISQAWNKSRTVAEAETRAEFEIEAKRISREWRRFVIVAESNIKDDAPVLADYEKAAYVLMGIKEEKRNPDHGPLWVAVDNFKKGWKDFGGNYRDSETFSRLSDYERFIEAVSDFGSSYAEMLEKGGI